MITNLSSILYNIHTTNMLPSTVRAEIFAYRYFRESLLVGHFRVMLISRLRGSNRYFNFRAFIFACCYFRGSKAIREIRENKTTAKITTYTVYHAYLNVEVDEPCK